MIFMNFISDFDQYNCGFAALLTVVIIGAAVFILAYGAAMLGLGGLESGYTAQRGSEAMSAADGCVEEALRRLRLDPAYTGGSVPFSGGAPPCTVTITDLGAGQRRIIGTGSIASGQYNKIIQMEVTIISPGNRITVNSWQEK